MYENKLEEFTSDYTLKQVNVTYVGDLDTHSIDARLYGYSLSLGGAIGVNFYMDLQVGQLSDDAYMLFTIPSGDNTTTEKVYVRDVIADETATVEMDGKTYYLFQCSVSAKDAASAITAQLIDREYSGSVYIFSVKEYAEYVLAHPGVEAFANASDMVKALLTYCTCAQKFFGTNPNNVDDYYITYGGLDTVTEIECADEEIRLGQIPDVTFAGATLSLKSEITLSLYFESDVELKFGCDNDMTVEYAKVGDRYQVARIRGISAKDLGESFELKITCGTEEGMVSYSVMNYCSKVLEGNYSDDLKNVVKSIYLYYTAAKQYS